MDNERAADSKQGQKEEGQIESVKPEYELMHLPLKIAENNNNKNSK